MRIHLALSHPYLFITLTRIIHFTHKLSGAAWVHSKEKENDMFTGSFGTIVIATRRSIDTTHMRAASTKPRECATHN